MAQQSNQPIEFVAVEAKDILDERQEMWAGFNRFTVYGIVIVAILLVLMAIFLV